MSRDNKYLAYIDESGGHGFNFNHDTNSKFFVINAILIKNEVHDAIKKQFEEIKVKYYPDSEMKSSKIGKKENIRLNILNELHSIDFNFFCLIVDKRKIYPNSGLQYKESFYKFLYGLLYTSLYKSFSQIEVIADELISSEFTISFENYVKENHLVDLFNQSKISFQKSNSESLLQLCDIIGGSINRFYSSKSEINPFEIFKDKLLNKTYWPEDNIQFTVELDGTNEYTDIISNLSLLRINDYIKKYEKTQDNVIKLRVMFLFYLRTIFLHNSNSRFVHTQEVIKYIEGATSEKIKEQYIRQQIVGPLRSEGILIVSNVNGYKIPSTKNDVIMFFNLFSKIINPMISRLKKSHEALFQATGGELNMLEYPEFEYLKKIIVD